MRGSVSSLGRRGLCAQYQCCDSTLKSRFLETVSFVKCEGHNNSANKMEAAEAAAAFQSHSVTDNLWVKRKLHQGQKSLSLLWHRKRITSQVRLFKSQCPQDFSQRDFWFTHKMTMTD